MRNEINYDCKHIEVIFEIWEVKLIQLDKLDSLLRTDSDHNLTNQFLRTKSKKRSMTKAS